jgi:transcriptional antiterminator NusG
MIKVPELPEASDESEEPNLEWFVLKVQSGREDTIREGIVRRVKMEGLDRYFQQVVVPTEKSTSNRLNGLAICNESLPAS